MKKFGALILAVFIISALGWGDSQDAQPVSAKNWKWLGPSGGTVVDLEVNPKNNKHLYALIFTNYNDPSFLYLSKNSGAKWTKIATFNNKCDDIAIYKKNPKIMYVLADDLVYKTTNGGKKWTELKYPDNFWGYKQIIVSPKNSNHVYACGEYTYDISTRDRCIALVISTNGGKSWTLKKFNPTSNWGYMRCIAQSQKKTNYLYAGGYCYRDGKWTYLVFKSINNGKSWTTVSGAPFKGTSTASVPPTGAVDGSANFIAVDPKNPKLVYVATSYGVWRSTNGGATWEKNNGYIYASSLAIDEKNPDLIYAGWSSSCYVSTDGGINWTNYTSGLHGLNSRIVVAGNFVFFSSAAGVYRSKNKGVNWTAANNGLRHAVVTAIANASSSPRTIYVEAKDNGLFLSTSNGKSWKRLPDFYRCDSILAIWINPTNPKHICILAGG